MFLALLPWIPLFQVRNAVELGGQRDFIRNTEGKAGRRVEALISQISRPCS